MSNKPNIVLMGKPGAGKGTEAQLMYKRGYVGVSIGDALRKMSKEDTPFGKALKNTMDSGAYVSDEIVMEVLKKSLTQKHGLLFDGFPRTLKQARDLDDMFKKSGMCINAVINIDTSDSLIIKRISNRFMCTMCGEIYNRISKKSIVEGVCDKCGSKQFHTRDDDKPDIIKKRLEVYSKEMKPIIEYYKCRKIYHKIKGINVEKTDKDVMKIINDL